MQETFNNQFPLHDGQNMKHIFKTHNQTLLFTNRHNKCVKLSQRKVCSIKISLLEDFCPLSFFIFYSFLFQVHAKPNMNTTINAPNNIAKCKGKAKPIKRNIKWKEPKCSTKMF